MLASVENWKLIEQVFEEIPQDEIFDFVRELAQSYVDKYCREVNHEDIGIDERSYGKIYISENGDDYLVTRNVSEYYSGLSYVPNDEKFKLGDYMFYSAENSRVKDHILNSYED